MDALAHGLWAAAAGTTARRKLGTRLSIPWTAFWGMFPDVLAFGPSVAVGLWLLATQGMEAVTGHHPHVHLGIPLYPLGHSLVTFAIAFGLASLAARRVVPSMLGWLTHILIDIPTHSNSYYATRFMWPFSDYGFDGVAWWEPWVMICTYAALALVYLLMWRKGWLRRRGTESDSRQCVKAIS